MAQKARSLQKPRGDGRRRILEAIRSAGAIARIDIAEQADVSPATVTAITSDLIAAGLIEEVATTEATTANARGRPRVSLKIRGGAHRVAGIKVSERSTTVCILDFEGETIGSYESPAHAPRLTPEAMARHLGDTLAAACRTVDLKTHEISAIGLGISGFVDAPRNFIHWSPSLTRRNVNLGALLARHMPAPVFIDNDVNLVAKAEQLFGEGRGVRDFLVVTIEHGVGLGIVVDGRIYRGERGCGAEFGHTKVQLDGALCRCGQRGCLEAYVADYALLREAQVNIPDIAGKGAEGLNTLFEAAKRGDQTARSIFQRAGRMFAMGLANLVNIFDPKLIILSGERMQFDFLYAEEVLEAIRSSVVQVDAPLPEVRIHKWGDLMWAKGAAAYAMEQVSAQVLAGMAGDGH